MSKGYYLMKCKASVLSILSLFMSSVLLTGCISDVWTGATMVYDRHNIYKKVGDFQLAADANRSLYKDQVFTRTDCSIELAVINGDMLLVGHVPTDTLRQEAHRRVAAVTGYRRLFNQLAVSLSADNTLQDDWITAKIRSRIFANADIDPHVFKVVTYDQIVYLMGDVVPGEAAHVIHIARACAGVKRVVKLFKYYHLDDRA